MRARVQFIFPLLLLILSACVRTASYGAPIDFRPTAMPQIAPGAARLVAPGMPVLDAAPERPLYTLNATLDFAKNVVRTQEIIEFLNPTGVETSEIKFNVPPAHHAGIIKVTDARIFGQPQPLRWVLTSTVLTVQLPAALSVKDGIAMAFNFELTIPQQENVVGIGGDDSSRGAFSLTGGHWYIMLAPFRDGDWDTPKYVPVGDPYTSDLADYEVSILAPEDVIIAGAGDEKREGRLWRYSLKQARVFAFSASDIYVVDSIDEDGVKFILYSYPAHRKFNEAILYTAARAVKLYTELYGPYQYKTLRIVEFDRTQGQEYSGMVGIGATLYRGYPGRGSRHDLIATTVHEIAHQWWFQTVGNDQARAPWLDESFARMAELRFYEKYYPRDVDWWYGYYISGNSAPRGNIDFGVYDYDSSLAYIDAVYRRGLIFLNKVRQLMGDDAFDAAMRDYYSAQSYKVTTSDAFFDALAKHSTKDISSLLRDYFSSRVTLPCKISNNASGCRR